jgi:peptidoglycan-associated lipoprotein
MKISRELLVVTVATLGIIGAGCAKKRVAGEPPTPPEPVKQASTSTPPGETPRSQQPPAARTEPTAAARPNMPDEKTRARIETLLGRIEDAYFDYDKHELRPDAIKALETDSKESRDILKDYPEYKLTVEGHCDERGSAEYNMVLGQARAEAARNYLVQVGIPAQQLGLISYGKEKPECQDHEESCWQKNRRVHIVAMAK